MTTADTGPPVHDALRAHHARWAMIGVFFLVGTVMASWFTQLPQFKTALGLTDGQLGVALFSPAAGALVSMQFTGWLVARFGSGPVVRVTAIALAPLLWTTVLADGLGQFVLLLFVFGLVDGVLDVAMNSHGIAVERAVAAPIMNGLHGAWSVGSIAGALSGALAVTMQWSLSAYLGTLAVVMVVTAAAATRWLLPATIDGLGSERDDPTKPKPSWRSGWNGSVVLLGLMGAACLLAGGAAESWSTIFLRDELGAAPHIAALGYVAFTVLQTAGRLVGDWLHQKIGPVNLVRWAGMLAVAGLTGTLAAPSVSLAIAGIAVYGAGLSVLVPVVFSAVGHGETAKGHSADAVGRAVARFTTLSYTGYLLGPAAVGWLGQLIGLHWALAIVLIPLLGVVVGAGHTSTALPAETSKNQ
jgi:MFS family permease